MVNFPDENQPASQNLSFSKSNSFFMFPCQDLMSLLDLKKKKKKKKV